MTRRDAAIARREHLLALTLSARRKLLARMTERQCRALRTHWEVWAHEGQSEPGGHWHAWLIMAGRGFGKTRAGVERVRSMARDPTARLALVAATLGEARWLLVEDESGLLAIAPWGRRPKYEPSRRFLTWDSGAQASLLSAGEPESLRGGNTVTRAGQAQKRIHRQSGAATRRSGIALHDRGRVGGASRHSAGVAGRGCSHGRVRRPRRGSRGLYRKRLAVHRRANRVEGLRQAEPLLSSLHRFLAALCGPGNAQRRRHDRSGSANCVR